MVDGLLYFGKDIKIGGITIYQYTIQDIETDFGTNAISGIDMFRNIMYISVRQPIDFMDRRKITLNEANEIDLFADIVCCGDNDLKNRYVLMLNIATKLEWQWNDITKEFVSYSDKNIFRINGQNFKQILNVIAKTYGITRYDPYEKYGDFDSADEYTKDVIYNLIQDELIESTENDSGMMSIIEGISCNKDSGVDVFTVGKLTLYQLFRVYKRVANKVNHDNVMLSAYGNATLKDGFKIQDVSLFREL